MIIIFYFVATNNDKTDYLGLLMLPNPLNIILLCKDSVTKGVNSLIYDAHIDPNPIRSVIG